MRNLNLRIFSYVVMAYMLLAFTWWSLLLFTKNRDAFYAKRDLMRIGMAAEGRVQNNAQFEETADYQRLVNDYQRQEWMIFGEASMFMLTLLAGLWFIHKSYYRQVQANQQQRNFLLAITHELKSPIASIRLVLETLLKRELPKDKSDKLALTGLKENERLYQLVENLLISARLETAYQPHFEEVNLAELLDELISKQRMRHPQAAFNLKKEPHIPLIHADSDGLTLLINNLIENGVKYSDQKPVVNIDLKSNGENLILQFADEGIGISEEDKKKVFEKFYRVGNEDTRKTKGTGLGLFIASQIVKAHKGEIRVLDNDPKGSVFEVKIPKSND